MTRTIAAASLTALALLAGCGSSDKSSTPSTTGTTVPPSTTTTKSVASLKTALLTPADVPGSTGSDPTPGNDTDLSACFPGNPIGVKTDPNEVSGPDLALSEPSGAQHQFSSSARQASPQQATDYVNTFASPSGSACALNGFKAGLSNDPKGPKLDASGLSGTATTAAVGDGGTVLALTGNVIVDGNTVPAAIDIVVFHKASVVVLILAGTFAGPPTPGLGVELANKVAGRLT
jgi:hypothetical protein